jgi:hypothetical protein
MSDERSVTVPIDLWLGKLLRKRSAIVQQLQKQIQTLAATDQELIASLLTDRGMNLSDFDRWDYVDGANGTIDLVLSRPPLEMPAQPVPHIPKE